VADPAAAAPSQAWPRAEAAGSGTEVEVGEVRGSHLRPRRRRQGYPATCPPLCPRLVYHAGSPLRAEGEGAFPGYQGRGFLGSPGSPGSHPPLWSVCRHRRREGHLWCPGSGRRHLHRDPRGCEV